jgi:hypothetical protein
MESKQEESSDNDMNAGLFVSACVERAEHVSTKVSRAHLL